MKNQEEFFSRTIILILVLFLFSPSLFSQIDINDYEKAVNLNNSAFKDIKNSNYHLAIKKSKTALSIDSLNRNSYLNLNYAYSKIGRYNSLIEYLQKAKRIFLEDDEILYYTGNAYKELGQIDKAIENYNLAIKYSKVNGEDYPIVYAYYLNRGICFNIKKKYELALSDFTYSLKLNNKAKANYANRAFSFFQLERRKEACRDWNEAYDLGEKSVLRYLNKFCR